MFIFRWLKGICQYIWAKLFGEEPLEEYEEYIDENPVDQDVTSAHPAEQTQQPPTQAQQAPKEHDEAPSLKDAACGGKETKAKYNEPYNIAEIHNAHRYSRPAAGRRYSTDRRQNVVREGGMKGAMPLPQEVQISSVREAPKIPLYRGSAPAPSETLRHLKEIESDNADVMYRSERQTTHNIEPIGQNKSSVGENNRDNQKYNDPKEISKNRLVSQNTIRSSRYETPKPTIQQQPHRDVRSSYFKDLDDVFAEIENVVNEAEEEAMLLNQGPNSSAGKREKVLAMGVPEPLYDELYEQGYFDDPGITKEYVRKVLLAYYTKDMAAKILHGDIQYSMLMQLKQELEEYKNSGNTTPSELKLSNDMYEILHYIDSALMRIKK